MGLPLFYTNIYIMEIDNYKMNEKELLALIQQGEGYNLEFKESLSDNFGKEICAFANANGGKILMGVTDKGEQKGIEITNRLKSQIQDISRNFDPKFEVFLEQVGNILIVHVPEGTKKPYAVKGHFYMRQGANSQQLSRDEIREFFQKEGIILFDEKPNFDFDLNKDFNTKAFKIFLEKTKITPQIDKERLLDNLELLKDKRMKNAGVLLFCNNVNKFFPGLSISCISFQGKERLKIIHSEEFNGDLYSNFEGALNFLKSNLNTEYLIRTAGAREEKLELPEEALRESLLNAIGHRSYFIRGNIQVNIFSDRVEITNPGGLVPGISIKELGKKSRPRNNLLFGLLQRMDLVEMAGTGIMRIHEAMKAYKLKKPTIEASADWFSIIFERPDLQKETYEDRIYGKRVTVKVTVKVTVNQTKILDEIRKNKEITVLEIAEKVDLSRKGVLDNISKLKKAGLLQRIGSDKTGYWEIVEK